jgi:hypothetical protein
LEPVPSHVAGAAEATPLKALQAIASNATDGIPFSRAKSAEKFMVFNIMSGKWPEKTKRSRHAGNNLARL